MVPVSLHGGGEVLESAGLIPSHPQRQAPAQRSLPTTGCPTCGAASPSDGGWAQTSPFCLLQSLLTPRPH